MPPHACSKQRASYRALGAHACAHAGDGGPDTRVDDVARGGREVANRAFHRHLRPRPGATRSCASVRAFRVACSSGKPKRIGGRGLSARARTSFGMTLWISPPWTIVTEITACSVGGTLRDTIEWSAVMVSAAVSTGSMAACGCEPCPPLPVMRILKRVTCAITWPVRVCSLPYWKAGQL